MGQCARGLVYTESDGVGFNTNAPLGGLSGSGWQYSGKLGVYLGTAISSNAVLSAKHLDVSVGGSFVYEGQTFTTTSCVDDAASDLAVWRVDGTFTNWAPIQIDSSPVGRDVVYLGRGMERGDVVVSGAITNGWKWGVHQRIQRWGENHIVGVADYVTGSGDQLLIGATFDGGAGSNECTLSAGDSGGGVFVEEASGWKLTGVNYSVWPAQFSTNPSGAGSYFGTLVDYSGLYFKNGETWAFAETNGVVKPCGLFSTHVGARMGWLTNTVPEMTFPAELGVEWGGATVDNSGVHYGVTLTNGGPYRAGEVAVVVSNSLPWRMRAWTASVGTYDAGSSVWLVPELADGETASLTLRGDVWSAQTWETTNVAVVVASDAPDGVEENNAALQTVTGSGRASVLMVR